jgi:hypothetical protein
LFVGLAMVSSRFARNPSESLSQLAFGLSSSAG